MLRVEESLCREPLRDCSFCWYSCRVLWTEEFSWGGRGREGRGEKTERREVGEGEKREGRKREKTEGREE